MKAQQMSPFRSALHSLSLWTFSHRGKRENIKIFVFGQGLYRIVILEMEQAYHSFPKWPYILS